MTVTICTTAKAFVTVQAFEDFLVEMRPKMHFETVVRFRAEHTQMTSERTIVRVPEPDVPS